MPKRMMCPVPILRVHQCRLSGQIFFAQQPAGSQHVGLRIAHGRGFPRSPTRGFAPTRSPDLPADPRPADDAVSRRALQNASRANNTRCSKRRRVTLRAATPRCRVAYSEARLRKISVPPAEANCRSASAPPVPKPARKFRRHAPWRESVFHGFRAGIGKHDDVEPLPQACPSGFPCFPGSNKRSRILPAASGSSLRRYWE